MIARVKLPVYRRRHVLPWHVATRATFSLREATMRWVRFSLAALLLTPWMTLLIGCAGSGERQDTRQDARVSTRTEERTEDRVQNRRD
jgi:hypothetical protein